MKKTFSPEALALAKENPLIVLGYEGSTPVIVVIDGVDKDPVCTHRASDIEGAKLCASVEQDRQDES
jgi:hypothetical protein